MSNKSANQSLLLSILSSPSYIGRLLLVVTMFAGILIMLLFAVLKIVKATIGADRVTITSEGAWVFELDNKRTVHWMFSSSELWAGCGVRVKGGDKIRVKASGRFNTSINHLYRYADTDTDFHFPWVGPDGNEAPLRGADSTRYPRRILTSQNGHDVPIGMLLMQIVPINDSALVRPPLERLFAVGSNCELEVPTNLEGTLYFAVNEIPLDSSESSRSAYVVTPEEDPAYGKSVGYQDSAWNKLVLRKDWNMWYEDNIGSIFVTIEFE